jgi:hypothetical protein
VTAVQDMHAGRRKQIMAAKIKESVNAHSPVSQLTGWARQGIDSFVAAQKILLDLTAQQNALVIGMLRENLSKPLLWPGDAIATIADKGVQNVSAAGKILLDLAADGTELVLNRVKDAVPLPMPASTVANLLRDRLVTLLDLQKRLLEAAAEQTHKGAESYREGKGLMAAGEGVAELARQAIDNLVETEKKFLDLAVHEVSAKPDHESHKSLQERYKVLTQLVREGGEKCIDAQQKLLNLAIEQMESACKTAGKRVESVRNEARTSLGDLTEKSVRNFATAQKSLMELVTKPAKAKEAATERKGRAPHVRARTPKAGQVVSKAA